MKSILAAVDFSDISSEVIQQAAKIAQCFSSKLWLIHVAAPEPDFVGYGTGPQSERDWRAKTLRQEHRYLQEQATQLQQNGIDVTPLLVQGATVETILSEATKLKAEMIVIGSNSRGILDKALLGSVSESIIRQALCPVLVVPTKTQS